MRHYSSLSHLNKVKFSSHHFFLLLILFAYIHNVAHAHIIQKENMNELQIIIIFAALGAVHLEVSTEVSLESIS